MQLLPLEEKLEFTPEFNSNKALDPKEQVIVKIKEFPSNEKIASFQTNFYEGEKYCVVYNDRAMFKSCGVSVQGLIGYQTGEDLLDSKDRRLHLLALEIRYFLINGPGKLTPGESKA